MPRPPRLEIAGHSYHVNCTAVDDLDIFRDDVDRAAFLLRLEKAIVACGWSLLGYTVMSTHYHLLIRLREPILSSGIQALNSSYAMAFNKRYGRRGAAWGSRYYSTLIDGDLYLREAVRYVARNAPRAGICDRPGDWPWCSYGATIDGDPPDPLIDEDELLGLFGAPVPGARERLRQFVEESDPRKRRCQTLLRPGSDPARVL